MIIRVSALYGQRKLVLWSTGVAGFICIGVTLVSALIVAIANPLTPA